MAKQIVEREESRQAILRGVNLLADACQGRFAGLGVDDYAQAAK